MRINEVAKVRKIVDKSRIHLFVTSGSKIMISGIDNRTNDIEYTRDFHILGHNNTTISKSKIVLSTVCMWHVNDGFSLSSKNNEAPKSC